jgi:hypothetical protein
MPTDGRIVHLQEYGFIKVFKTRKSDYDFEFCATVILEASESGGSVHDVL